jgi:cell division protein FtsQ
VPKKKSAPKKPVRGFAHGGPGGATGRIARTSVSTTSAQRFAARIRARRRRRVLIVVAALLVVNGLAWLALLSPWATVQRVVVTGTNRVPVAEVRDQAEPEVGHPILLARTDDIAARVSRQRLIRSVQVKRLWSGTIKVSVVERFPVAALPSDGTLALVDRDGVVIEKVAKAPAGLPRLEVGLGASEVPALRGGLAVLAQLPTSVSKNLQAIGADTPDGIWLKLRDKKAKRIVRVEWGNSDRTPQKARVLTALLRHHAATYDVRSPDKPAYAESAGSGD